MSTPEFQPVERPNRCRHCPAADMYEARLRLLDDSPHADVSRAEIAGVIATNFTLCERGPVPVTHGFHYQSTPDGAGLIQDRLPVRCGAPDEDTGVWATMPREGEG